MKQLWHEPLSDDRDTMFDDAVRLVIEHENASASFIQRKLSIGYARAARILDEMQIADIVGPADGAAPREILIKSLEEYRRGKASHETANPPPHKPYVIPEFNLKTPRTVPWGKPFAGITFDKMQLPFGHDKDNKLVTISLAELGHLLVVGNPQSKKMEFLDTVIPSVLIKAEPKSLQLILIDESGYLNLYNSLPHLLSPVITEAEKSQSALKWVLTEISRRKKLFLEADVREFDSYGKASGFEALPRILLVSRLIGHDQLLDSAYTQITSYGHQTGIQMIMVVDQASGSYISNQVKSNIPNRLVFQTTTPQDSISAGVSGAHKLNLGQAILKLNNSPERLITTIYSCEADVKEVVNTISKANEY
jgi:DNA segregation ATPase FtsK/SpoIIIE-like protein